MRGFMEEQIETRVAPEEVWRAWERARQTQGKHKVFNVKPGESFSLLWKSLFVRLIFTHTVKPAPKGSHISYKVEIQGPFAWPLRWLLGKKIRHNISYVLKAVVKELENKGVK